MNKTSRVKKFKFRKDLIILFNIFNIFLNIIDYFSCNFFIYKNLNYYRLSKKVVKGLKQKILAIKKFD